MHVRSVSVSPKQDFPDSLGLPAFHLGDDDETSVPADVSRLYGRCPAEFGVAALSNTEDSMYSKIPFGDLTRARQRFRLSGSTCRNTQTVSERGKRVPEFTPKELPESSKIEIKCNPSDLRYR